MAKAKEFGHLAEALASKGKAPVAENKKAGPASSAVRLNVHAHLHDSTSYGPGSMDDSKWRKEERKRLRNEIKATEQHIKDFNHEEAGKKVLRSLQADLLSKKARLMETEAM